jgi:hypothetical protein
MLYFARGIGDFRFRHVGHFAGQCAKVGLQQFDLFRNALIGFVGRGLGCFSEDIVHEISP